MKSQLITVDDHGLKYTALKFVCSGCEREPGHGGLHMLAVNSEQKKPSWGFNGNFEAPTLTPSIKSDRGDNWVCHSFLRNGIFEFLSDSTHQFSGMQIPIPDLYEWAIKE